MLFLLSLTLNYSMHYDYPIPLHSDEYDHLATVAEMDSKGERILYDPYITEYRFAQRNLELNYDFFLLALYQITGMDLLQMPLVVPVLLTFLMSLAVFVLVKFLTDDRLAALLSGIFVLFLHNNIAFLGYWILVPMALGLATIPVMAYLFLRGLRSWAYALLLAVVFINIALSHAVYAVIFIPAFFLYILLTPREWKLNPLKIAVGALILLALSARFVQWQFTDLALTFARIVDFLIWPYGTNTPSYPLLPYLTLLALGLAVIGFAWLLLPLLKNSKGKIKQLIDYRNKKEEILHYPKLLLFFAAVLFLVRVYADLSGTCLLGPCRRVTPALAIMILIAAGIGFAGLVRALNRFSSRLSPRAGRVITVLAILGVLAFVAHQLFTEPYTHIDGFYRNVELGEVDAIRWITPNSHDDFVIMALPWAAKPVYLISGRKVVETGAARLGASLASQQDIIDFPSASCEDKEKTFEKRGPDIIYGGKAYMDCNFLDMTYNKGRYYVYVPNK